MTAYSGSIWNIISKQIAAPNRLMYHLERKLGR